MPFEPLYRITDGSEQSERMPAALMDDYFRIDELSLEDLLAQSVKLSSYLNYYNFDFQRDGSWSELFLADESAVLSLMATADLKLPETKFLHLLKSAPDEEAAQYILSLSAMLDGWLKQLSAIQGRSARTLYGNLSAMIGDNLAGKFQSLVGWLKKRKVDDFAPSVRLPDFERIWFADVKRSASSIGPDGLFETKSQKDLKNRLRSCFYIFLNAAYYMKKTAQEYMAESLHSKTHDPAMALFIAFLHLYGKVQAHLNAFTRRHTDFYYREYLKIQPRPAVSSRVYLALTCAAGKTTDLEGDGGGILVPKGTAFSAGRDANGDDIVYRTETDVPVTDAVIKDVRSLRFGRHSRISPERELGYVTGIRAAGIFSGKWPQGRNAESSPIFGQADEIVDSSYKAQQAASIGFAVASSALLLNEGHRAVEIAILFDEFKPGMSDLMKKMEQPDMTPERFFKLFGILFRHYILSCDDILDRTQKDSLLGVARKILPEDSYAHVEELLAGDRQDLFYTLFTKMFIVELTAKNGWFTVADPVILRVENDSERGVSGLRFVFALGPEAPPIVSFDPAVHKGGFATNMPVGRFVINHGASFFPYSLFLDVGVREIAIDVSVGGIQNITAGNNYGPLDLSKPFSPFGALPSLDSYFVFGNSELSQKKPTGLKLNLEWGALPRGEDGFAGYYAGYPGDYANDAFKVQLSVLQNYRWHPDRNETPVETPLFTSADSTGRVDSRRTLMVDNVLKYFQTGEPKTPESEFVYNQSAASGFFRLSLSGPETAFGHEEYTPLITSILMKNAKAKRKDETLALPKTPYVPIINRMTLDYTASAVLQNGCESVTGTAAALEFYRIHPFGTEKAFADSKGIAYLLPQYTPDGNLLIGFEAGLPGGVLSFLFHLKNDSAVQAASDRRYIRWSYMAGNQWHDLDDVRVHSDTTNGFLITGVVTLDIPDDISRQNDVLPSGLFWIRASAQYDLDTFCSLYSVRFHGVRAASDQAPGSAEGSEVQIAPGSIKEPLVAVPGLGAVFQPESSYKGGPPETDSALITRASERLRHKNRAVTGWDYEHLILERFPSVFKVKCFSAMSSVDPHAAFPGRLLIVVIPQCREGEAHEKPYLNEDELNKIRNFVRACSSPFVSVEVCNPKYETIQVRCAVKLASWAHSRRGIYLNQLNGVISDFISPWKGKGQKARFGWSIRRSEVEAHILELDYVDFVTKFSMLHISEDKSVYSLEDTACLNSAGVKVEYDQIYPTFPWSIAVPMDNHFVSCLNEDASITAKRTGINELQIGTTLIIGADHV